MTHQKLTRKSLAGLLRVQKQLFQTELYQIIADQENETEREIIQRIYEASTSIFEICARIIEGTKVVGYIDPAYEGGLQ